MSIDHTQEAMHRYFDLMGEGADFAECYTADVSWLVADSGEIIQGAAAVRDYVIALHASRADWRTHTYVVGPDHVYLEGDCADVGSDHNARTRYCVAYDVEEGRIHAMRCYGFDYRPAS